MSNTIKITENNEVQLPIYVKKGEGRYVAVMGRVQGGKDSFNEVQVSHSMVATYSHMDAVGALREIMSGEHVTREEFTSAVIEAQVRINAALGL